MSIEKNIDSVKEIPRKKVECCTICGRIISPLEFDCLNGDIYCSCGKSIRGNYGNCSIQEALELKRSLYSGE